MQKLFPGQQDNERICLILRQHWFVLFKHLAVWFVFLLVLLIGHVAVVTYVPDLAAEPYVNILNTVETLYLMFLLLGLLILWVLYHLNYHIITNERVVDVMQKGLVHHTISELSLNRIQDVTAEVHGFVQTFLDYGNVYLQTAGETERFVFERVPNPTKVAKAILDLYAQLPPEEKAKGG